MTFKKVSFIVYINICSYRIETNKKFKKPKVYFAFNVSTDRCPKPFTSIVIINVNSPNLETMSLSKRLCWS